MKLAAYLDQASEDPKKAMEVLVEHGIKAVVLRRVWSRNITRVADTLCASIRAQLNANDLKVVLLCTDVGYCPTDKLLKQTDQLDRALVLCDFFGCKYLRLGIGQATSDSRAAIVHEAWMRSIEKKCKDANVTPCLEISYNFSTSSPAGVASILHKYPNWKIIYDPVVLIQSKKIDPFTRYWTLIKDRVSHIDVRDHIIGHAPVPPGQGDAKLDLTISDAILSGYGGWYCLEHGLSRKHGTVSGLDNIFKMAKESFDALLKQLDLGKK